MSGATRAEARAKTGGVWSPVLVAATLAGLAVLLGAGWGHRVLVGEIDRSIREVVEPRQPLAEFPLVLGAWDGREIELDPRVLRAANFDDLFINRSYFSRAHDRVLSVFLGYVGRPRAHMGHRPDRCYAAHGYEQVGEERITVQSADGREVPAVLYEFRDPRGGADAMLVLATYMINGQYTQEAAAFRRYNTGAAGLLGERPAYLARLQVGVGASGDRAADLAALQDFVALAAEHVAALMPYWDE
jgi:hypothetical protein